MLCGGIYILNLKIFTSNLTCIINHISQEEFILYGRGTIDELVLNMLYMNNRNPCVSHTCGEFTACL